ncbi:hypothetical protein JCM3770_001087 [Rhodotorula araucariae]
MVRSTRALDLVLGVLPRVGDVEAVDALMAVMRDQADVLGAAEALEPSEACAEKIVRWAVAQRGRDEVLAGDGWLSTAARRVLSARTTV